MSVLDAIRGRSDGAGGASREARRQDGGLLTLVWRWAGLAAAPPEDVQRGCMRCGQCCEAFGAHLHASKADLERWTRLGRQDLLRRVGPVTGWIWLDPETGTLERSCPFLETTGPATKACSIQDVKPDMCRDYPTLAHGRRCLKGFFLACLLVPFGDPVLLALLRAGAG